MEVVAMIDVEKNVPFQKGYLFTKKKNKFFQAFMDMEVGDSFVIDESNCVRTPFKDKSVLQATACQTLKRSKSDLMCVARKIGPNCYRIWKLKRGWDEQDG